MARKRSRGSELEQILQSIDPPQLKNIAFDLGADFYVFPAPKLPSELIQYFDNHNRLYNFALQIFNTPNQDRTTRDQLGHIFDQLPASGPDYRLLIIQAKPIQPVINVPEIKELFARWRDIGPGDVTFMGAVRESEQLSMLIGVPETTNDPNINRIRETAEQNNHSYIPVSINWFDAQAKPGSRWRILVTQVRKKQAPDEYRPYTWSETTGSAFNKAQFAGIVLIVLVLAAVLIYPGFVAWIEAAQLRAQMAWANFAIQMSIAFKFVGNVLGYLILLAFTTGVALVFMIGLTVVIFPLEKCLLRDRQSPPIRESLSELYVSYGWVILTVANVFACVFSLLVASMTLNHPLTGWEWGAQIVLALGIEGWGIPRFVDWLKAMDNAGEGKKNN